MLNIMLNMKKLTTRELVHHAKDVQAALERGESFVWTSRGQIVGYIQPAQAVTAADRGGHDWIRRARAAGATALTGQDLSGELVRNRR